MDRNFDTVQIVVVVVKSLSARRAWIEIWSAVLTELLILSLSARRAWIEICGRRVGLPVAGVALRKESVDRNTIITKASAEIIRSLSARRAWIEISFLGIDNYKTRSRSPQGERG